MSALTQEESSMSSMRSLSVVSPPQVLVVGDKIEVELAPAEQQEVFVTYCCGWNNEKTRIRQCRQGRMSR